MKKIIIVDIDGTITRVGDRKKYLLQEPKDWDMFFGESMKDKPKKEIIDLLETIYDKYEIVFCTGRRDSIRNSTWRWMRVHLSNELLASVQWLLMCKDGDHRSDTKRKPELLKKFLKEQGKTLDDVAFVLEDRAKVVKTWREMGLTCLQVANGDF